MDNDGILDIAVGSRDDGGTFFGAVWIIFLNADKTVKTFKKISPLDGQASVFGYAVRGIGDLNKDGINDLAVGAVYDGDGGYQYGAVWILFLNSNGTVKSSQKISSTAGGFTGTLTALSSFGSSIANLGDLDGDGNTDIAVGAYRDDGQQNKTGSVYILFLNSNGTVKNHTKISGGLGGLNTSLDYEDYFGISATDIGDLDGDGVTDLVVGSHRDDDGSMDAGALWVLFLNTDGTVKSFQKISATSGNFTGSLHYENLFGASVEKTGDINGDGTNDLVVGAVTDNDGGFRRGAIWFLYMNTNGTVKGQKKISHNQGETNLSLKDNDYFGQAICSLGDLDGDNELDIIISAIRDDDGGPDRGALWITGKVCPALVAEAGPDSYICNGDTQTTLRASLPNPGSGKWETVYGGGVIEHPNNPNTAVYNLTIGLNSFLWTVSSDPECPLLRDTVSVFFQPALIPPDAGEDQFLCNTTLTQLNAQDQENTIGRWVVAEGGAKLGDESDPQTVVTNLSSGRNTFIWKITASPNCESLADTVFVHVSPEPAPKLKEKKIVICNERSIELNAIPTEYGNGTWEIISGVGELEDPTNPAAVIRNLDPTGETTLHWTIYSDYCPPKFETLSIITYGLNPDSFPNVFTPNGDYKNDSLEFPGLQNFEECELKIINRWGGLVYQRKKYLNDWQGDALPAGVYYYTINLPQCNKEIKGWVYILK